jgi:pimeloyl-ACP methyl ester carboxylesterase
MDLNYQWHQKELVAEGKPVIVFLHEGLGSIGQWKDFPELLSKGTGLPALVYDRYGYGQSPNRAIPIHPQFLHEEAFEHLPAFIESLNIQNPLILFGHSDGGTIALLHASKSLPQLIGCLVEAPHVILEKMSFNGIRTARAMLRNQDLIERFAKYHGERSYALIDEWTSMWLSLEDGNWDMLEELKAVELPLCLIQGDEDNFGTFEQLHIVKQEVQSECVEIHKLKACGHIPHLQKKEEVLEISRKFISSIVPQV